MLLCSAVTAAMLAGSLACNTEFQVPADPAKLAVIAGTIVDADGEGLPDARVSTLDGAGAATTDCDGFYSLLVPDRWSGSVQVDFTDARFSPLLRRHAYVKDVLWSEFRAPIAPIDRLNNCADKPPVATAPACHSDAECDDGKYCNGVEVCDSVRGCLRGVPVACDDGVACTADACNEAARACKHEFRDSACDDRLFAMALSPAP